MLLAKVYTILCVNRHILKIIKLTRTFLGTFSGGEKTLIAENMRKIFVISLVVSLLLFSVSISSVHAYTNAIYGFSIDPPNGWTADDTVSYAAVVFYGPIDQGFRVNVNIQVEPTSASLAKYISARNYSFKPLIITSSCLRNRAQLMAP